MRIPVLGFPLLLSLFACGTQTIGASSEGTVPKMATGANLRKWEHLCMGTTGLRAYSDFLNEAGEQGWELVGITDGGVICFKRPKASPAASQARPVANTST